MEANSETTKKRCPCLLEHVATEEEHPEAHRAGRCVECYEIDCYVQLRHELANKEKGEGGQSL